MRLKPDYLTYGQLSVPEIPGPQLNSIWRMRLISRFSCESGYARLERSQYYWRWMNFESRVRVVAYRTPKKMVGHVICWVTGEGS